MEGKKDVNPTVGVQNIKVEIKTEIKTEIKQECLEGYEQFQALEQAGIDFITSEEFEQDKKSNKVDHEPSSSHSKEVPIVSKETESIHESNSHEQRCGQSEKITLVLPIEKPISTNICHNERGKPQSLTSQAVFDNYSHRKIAIKPPKQDNSIDAPSVGSSEGIATQLISTPVQRKVKRGGNTNVTPYITFASEIRKRVTDENKGCSFGEISKLIGDKWRSLSNGEKSHFEVKAKQINEDNAKKQEEERKLEEQ